jgi:hypothetical protein
MYNNLFNLQYKREGLSCVGCGEPRNKTTDHYRNKTCINKVTLSVYQFLFFLE